MILLYTNPTTILAIFQLLIEGHPLIVPPIFFFFLEIFGKAANLLETFHGKDCCFSLHITNVDDFF